MPPRTRGWKGDREDWKNKAGPGGTNPERGKTTKNNAKMDERGTWTGSREVNIKKDEREIERGERGGVTSCMEARDSRLTGGQANWT